MSPLLPVAVYGLQVPAGDIPIPASTNFPATFRITMAAIDPTAPPNTDAVSGVPTPRATLKLIRSSLEDEESDDDDDDIDAIRARLGDAISEDEDESESDEEANGGPSDPAKSKKARKAAAVKALIEAIRAEGDDMEVDEDAPNGAKINKGKGKALDVEDEDDDEEDEDEDELEEMEIEEFVICTLDPEKNYQQTLDITIGEDERVYFKVTGTHDVYLTGNYVIPPNEDQDDDYDSDEEDMDYDLSPDEDELDDEYDDEDEEDLLDGLADPRITELGSDDDAEPPKLVKAEKKGKGKNKRTADEEEIETLDDLIKNATKAGDGPAEKLSKKQAKKLKNNAGEAIPAAEKKDEKTAAKTDKKVQFAKNLEQGPTGSPKVESKTESKKDDKKLGPKVVQGVTIDDRKTGTGRPAKKGDKIAMRYIGKLEKDGKVFDSNKKGAPFSFKLGVGEVIKGWDIGVTGMCVGGERRLTIPASLAYGSRGMPGIPANSTLVFDIKMLKLN